MADEPDTDWITAQLRRSAVTERAPAQLRRTVDALSAASSARGRSRPQAGRPPALGWVLRRPSALGWSVQRLPALGWSVRRQPALGWSVRRQPVLMPAAGVIATVIVALVLLLPGATPGGPTVAEAAAIGAQATPPLSPPAGVSGPYVGGYTRFVSFAGVRFPSGLTENGWLPTGESVKTLEGRKLLTIDYTRYGDTVAYSIAAAPVLRGQRAGFTGLTVSHRAVISWEETNHSCLLSSADVPRAILLELARS